MTLERNPRIVSLIIELLSNFFSETEMLFDKQHKEILLFMIIDYMPIYLTRRLAIPVSVSCNW